MKKKYIYDVKTSRLFDINGLYIKTLFCPKAKHWNQLIADDPQDRSRGCTDCGERVINLDNPIDVMPSDMSSYPSPCVYIAADSQNVIILDDEDETPASSKLNKTDEGIILIKTARTVESINRAAGMGYWPDVRLIKYADKPIPEKDTSSRGIETILEEESAEQQSDYLRSKLSVGQNSKTGRIEISGDFRHGFLRERGSARTSGQNDSTEVVKEIIPFTYYYPNYQALPIAAYLIPPTIKNGTRVVIEDPIEDIIGSSWNQGDIERAYEVMGWIKNRKIVIDHASVEKNDFIG